MDRDIIFSGIHIGEHSFEPEKVIDEIYERCVKPGYNFVTIRTRRTPVDHKYFIEWAGYLAAHKIYFVFLYTIQHAPPGMKTQFDKEVISRIKEIAGEYFIGDMIGETGSSFACKFPGYYSLGDTKGPDTTDIRTDFPDMKAACEAYIESVSEYIEIDKELGVPNIVSVEATGLNKYNAAAGVDIPMLELMCGNPEVLVSSLRGVARAKGARLWGTYVAHEWYGGMRHDDPLKRKRLELAYKYAYLAGSNAFCLESGDEVISSYGHVFEKESDICQDYRDVLNYISDYIKKDARPVGGPKVKIAFVSGLYDAYGGWGGSTVWNQFGRTEWGHDQAEHSWRILDEIGYRRTWNDIGNYGERDLSALPAYGMYDIIPIEADVEALSRYDYLIFLGWNTMTDENMDKLLQYTENGGHLLMCGAHLNYEVKRAGALIMPSEEKVRRLFGAHFTGEVVSTNNGVKFLYDSLNVNAIYPGTKSEVCDPIYSAGYVSYGRFETDGGRVTAYVSGSFWKEQSDLPAVIENQVGSGIATLVTSMNYPGHPALLPLYRAMVREIVTSSARQCEIKILGSDRLRYAVYEGNQIYLLNTDYDLPATVKIITDKGEESVTLDPLELKKVEGDMYA